MNDHDLYETNELPCPDCGETMTFCGYLEVPSIGLTEVPVWHCQRCWDTWNPVSLSYALEYKQEWATDDRHTEQALMRALL